MLLERNRPGDHETREVFRNRVFLALRILEQSSDFPIHEIDPRRIIDRREKKNDILHRVRVTMRRIIRYHSRPKFHVPRMFRVRALERECVPYRGPSSASVL